ncbi:hypothetical protein [Erwinia sp. S38]|uniref:hypothetical protein n=1 Tax=Erwinia sp. S38 TaxID=2769338 RepID=UPI0019097BB4|nr:hypothetical protein [Erwinia sp. S38]MBK0000289.1 hypothetical protein [Erwinia sp. S38]
MKLKIRTIHGHGKASEEYVILDVIKECNADFYMILDTTFTNDGKISNKNRHSHWFLPADLKPGDVIVLFTKEGQSSTKKQDNGSTIYFRYWGLKSAVWNDDGDGAVLIEINAWKTSKVGSTK